MRAPPAAWPCCLQVWLQTSGAVPIPYTPGYSAARAALLRARGRTVTDALERELAGVAVSPGGGRRLCMSAWSRAQHQGVELAEC